MSPLPDALVPQPGEPTSPVLTPEQASVLVTLRRGHVMGCSDASDPSRHTTYGDAALVVEDLAARLEAATSPSINPTTPTAASPEGPTL